MSRFEGKAILITGGGSGIGQATAHRLVQEGAQVMIVGRTEEKLEDAAKKIKTDTGVEIKTLSADVSCMEDCEAMVQEVVSTFGKIDCAFLNAGIMVEEKISEASEENFNKLFNVNTKGVLFGLKCVGNAMKEAGTRGTILVESSVLSHEVRSSFTLTKGLYGASKAANDVLIKYAAGEYADAGIRVNAIAPGMVYTNMADMGSPEKTDEAGSQIQLVNRAGRPEEIAAFAAFLLSEEASFLTGCTYDAEGGWHIKA